MKIDFEALYREHYRRVHGLCLRLLGRAAKADDAVQEVFLRAYRALDRYDPHQPFAAWITGIASNHCVDLMRQHARNGKLFDSFEADAGELEASAPTALDTLIDAEGAAEIRSAIAQLPDKYRIPIVLAYYNESSYEDIAHSLGIDRNHVGVLLLRGKQLLRRRLAPPAEAS